MMLAGTFEASDGGPTVLLYLIVAGFSVAAAVGMLLGLRWHDRRRQLRERQPWQQVILHNRQMGEEVQHLAERHERIIRQRGQWLADQVTEHGEQLKRVETAVSQILAVAAEECPDQFVKRPDSLRLVKDS